MPQIQGYEEKVIAQGGLNTQANPDAFGAGIGEAAQRLGYQVDKMGDAIQAADTAMDTTNVHVTFAKARAEWDKNLEERRREAQPGDDTFAPRVMADVEKWTKDASASVKTRTGANLFKSMAANMATEYNGRAMAMQAQLNSEAAVNMLGTLKSSVADRAKRDVNSAFREIDDTFNDKTTIFWKVNQAHRDAMKLEVQRVASLADIKAQADRNQFSPVVFKGNVLKDLRAYESVMDKRSVPGGAIKISEATMAQAPEFAAVAASKNILANVLMAQHDALPNNTPEAQGGIMANLSVKYNDVAKAVAAYQGGTELVDFAVGMGGDYWGDYLPEATKAHVETVMANAGQIPSNNTPVPPSTQPVRTEDERFNLLTADQQEEAVTYGLRSMERSRMMQSWTRQEVERQKKESSDASVNRAMQMLINANKFGRMDVKALASDETMDGDTKYAVYMRFMADQERRKAGVSLNDQDERRRLYQDFVRQARENNSPNMRAANDSVMAGKLSPESHKWLQSAAAYIQNDASTSFGLAFKKATRGAERTIERGIASFDRIQGVPIMEKAKGIVYDAYEAKKYEYEKAGKPDGPLVDPMSKEYMFSDARSEAAVKQAMNEVGGAQVEAVNKADEQAAAKPVHPQTGEALTVGSVYSLGHGPQVYLGGNPRVSASWSAKGADVTQVVIPTAPAPSGPQSVVTKQVSRTLRKFWTGGK